MRRLLTPLRAAALLLTAAVVVGAAAAALELPEGAATGWQDGTLQWWVLGARYSVASWLAATAMALLLGTSLGLAAAVGPRLVGLTLSRSVELAGAAPSIVVAAILVEHLAEHRTITFVATIALLRSIDVACVIREKSAEVATMDFVRAARASGASPFRIVRRHLAPHVAGGAAASALLTGPALLGVEAALVYLGVAEPFPASWTRPLATPGAASPHALAVAALSIGCLMATSYVLARAVDVTSALWPTTEIGNPAADD